MSADTTVVIAAYEYSHGERRYTATVVQAAEDLLCENQVFALEKARYYFLEVSRPWFKGKGGLSRAKQFATLLAEEERENGILEYEHRPLIEITSERVYALSRKGKRMPDWDWRRATRP